MKPHIYSNEKMKELRAEQRLKEKERLAKLTPEQRLEEKRMKKEQKEYNDWKRSEKKKENDHKKLVNRELKILKFMKKTKVPYHHHGRIDVINIDPIIEQVKLRNDFTTWNEYRGHVSYSLLGCIFDNHGYDFETIYDVPLDETYRFQIYDSGIRGLGSFNYIRAIHIEDEAYIPYVNPGAIIPITA